MDNAWALDAANAGKGRAAMMQQGVDQRAGPVAGGRMDDHAGRLVDDDEVLILVEHIKGDCFGQRGGVDRLGDFENHCYRRPCSLRLTFGCDLAIEGHRAFADQLFDSGARDVFGHLAGKPGVKAGA